MALSQSIANFDTSETMDKQHNIHYIPAKIEFNGKANVDTKFINRISTNEDGTLDVEFRGRPLNGAKIQLPSNFNGFVAARDDVVSKTDDSASAPSTAYKLISEFSELTYWNWDKKPSKNDAFVKMQDWLHVSELIHSPIITSDYENNEVDGDV